MSGLSLNVEIAAHILKEKSISVPNTNLGREYRVQPL